MWKKSDYVNWAHTKIFELIFLDEVTDLFRYLAGAWGIAVSFVGIFGNFTTIIIILYITKKPKMNG